VPTSVPHGTSRITYRAASTGHDCLVAKHPSPIRFYDMLRSGDDRCRTNQPRTWIVSKLSTDMNAEIAIRTVNLIKSNDSATAPVYALRGLTLDVMRGERVALLGKSARENRRCSTCSADSITPRRAAYTWESTSLRKGSFSLYLIAYAD